MKPKASRLKAATRGTIVGTIVLFRRNGRKQRPRIGQIEEPRAGRTPFALNRAIHIIQDGGSSFQKQSWKVRKLKSESWRKVMMESKRESGHQEEYVGC